MPQTLAQANDTTPDPDTTSALSQVAPGLASQTARFLTLEAGWTPEMLDCYAGDLAFTAEVQAEMRRATATGTAVSAVLEASRSS
jgi:hypothetical protein